jgi:hypothetical protein
MDARNFCHRAQLLRAAGELLITAQLTAESPRVDYAWLNSLVTTPDAQGGKILVDNP